VLKYSIMTEILDKSVIINAIKLHKKFKKDIDFADFLGIPQATLANWHRRNTFDIDIVYGKCPEIDANWLLTGEGEMLKRPKEEPVPPLAESPASNLLRVDNAVLKDMVAAQKRYIEQLLDANKKLIETNNTLARSNENLSKLVVK
jgi:hypothetical protein